MGRQRLQCRLLHQLLLAIYDARLSRNSRGGDFKVVVRPRGGLYVTKQTPRTLLTAISSTTAVSLQEALAQDQLRLHPTNNTFTLSTPVEARARAYAELTSISLGASRTDVTAYLAPPDDAVRCIIHMAYNDEPHREILEGLVPYNPDLPIIDARPFGKKRSLLITLATASNPSRTSPGPIEHKNRRQPPVQQTPNHNNGGELRALREEVRIPRGTPTLTPDAVPTILPNVAPHLSERLPPERNVRKRSEEDAVPRKRRRLSTTDESAVRNRSPSSVSDVLNEPTANDDALATIAALRDVKLPNRYWTFHELREVDGACFTSCSLNASTGEVKVEKAVFFTVNADGGIHSRTFVQWKSVAEAAVFTMLDAETVLDQASLVHLCKGAGTQGDSLTANITVNLQRQLELKSGAVFSVKCLGSTKKDGTPCFSCKYLRKALITRQSRIRKRHKTSRACSSTVKKLKVCARRNKRLMILLSWSATLPLNVVNTEACPFRLVPQPTRPVFQSVNADTRKNFFLALPADSGLTPLPGLAIHKPQSARRIYLPDYKSPPPSVASWGTLPLQAWPSNCCFSCRLDFGHSCHEGKIISRRKKIKRYLPHHSIEAVVEDFEAWAEMHEATTYDEYTLALRQEVERHMVPDRRSTRALKSPWWDSDVEEA
ncbi:hypothetical protein MRX96_038244 [Rhipicephalus microplus]